MQHLLFFERQARVEIVNEDQTIRVFDDPTDVWQVCEDGFSSNDFLAGRGDDLADRIDDQAHCALRSPGEQKLIAGARLTYWETEAPANVHDRNHPPLSVDHPQHDIRGVRKRRDFYHAHDSLHCRKQHGIALRIERKDHKLMRLMPLVTGQRACQYVLLRGNLPKIPRRRVKRKALVLCLLRSRDASIVI